MARPPREHPTIRELAVGGRGVGAGLVGLGEREVGVGRVGQLAVVELRAVRALHHHDEGRARAADRARPVRRTASTPHVSRNASATIAHACRVPPLVRDARGAVRGRPRRGFGIRARGCVTWHGGLVGDTVSSVGLFEVPDPPTATPRVRAVRRVPSPDQRLIPGDAERELALAEQAARRRHPSARRSAPRASITEVRAAPCSEAVDEQVPAARPSPRSTVGLRLAR
jgi:hypothetical protein